MQTAHTTPGRETREAPGKDEDVGVSSTILNEAQGPACAVMTPGAPVQQGLRAGSLPARAIGTWVFPEGYLGVDGVGVTLGVMVMGIP